MGGADARPQGVQEIIGSDAEIPRYHALVIGINDYQHMQGLRQAREDAEHVAGLLGKRYGYQDVRTLYDRAATREAIETAVRRLAKELTAQDALLIYFSGHGYFDSLIKKGYWIPSEARESLPDGDPATMDWVHHTQLKEYISSMKAGWRG